ncbi:hypothetical protein L6164_037772 [Bauhinia variegata]|uniref:Uncharacterized protein n=1 Tax=Bauhinia variegata TaxID=167791 RepID=A0ACB9KL97_BAUVA|nr:hypothetical protein L6164_037772 [Bauhinia variegata]
MPRANVRVPRRYGAEVTHAILPGKARTTFNKRVPVPETDTGVEEPHQSIPNLVVKLYCGDDTVGEVLRKNSSAPG